MTRAARRLLPAAALAFGLAAWSRPAFAYRPFDGTDAVVADPREIEIELGPLGYLQEDSDRTLVVPAVVLNYGFAAGWEFVLQGQGEHPVTGESRTSQLVGNYMLLKHVLREGVLQEKSGISIATEFGLLLPGINGDPGVGATIAAIGSLRTDWLTIHLNANASVTRQGNPDLFFSSIVEGPFDWSARPVAETYYEHTFGGPETESVLIGGIWQVKPNRSFDMGLRTATINRQHVSEIRLGLTFGFSA